MVPTCWDTVGPGGVGHGGVWWGHGGYEWNMWCGQGGDLVGEMMGKWPSKHGGNNGGIWGDMVGTWSGHGRDMVGTWDRAVGT